MVKNELYEKVISEDNLIRAWDHVRYDARDDYAPDVFGYGDVGSNLNGLLKTIHDRLSFDNYQASPLKHIDVPKSTLAVRPGSVPEIEDRIVSYAIINIIAPEIDNELSEGVYAFRVKKDYETSKSGLFEERKEFPFLKKKAIQRVALIEDWQYAWPVFYEVSKYLYEEEGYNFLSISDISSYFENINHEILREHLSSLLPNEQKTINLLMEILDRWVWQSGTMRRLGRGIPQRNDVSSFLGNVFLIPLDEKLGEYSKTHDIRFIRYMDDILIFSKSPDVAREVLFVMNNTFRNLYLNVQGSKTQILKGKEIEKELFPSGMDELNETIDKMDDALQKSRLSSKEKSFFEKELKTHFAKFSEKGKWERHEQRLFSRLLTGFKKIESDALVKRCLKEIEQNPDERMNAKIISYLRLFPRDRVIIERIAKFLLSSVNKFEYQEAHLFLLYRYLDEIPKQIFDYMKAIAFDREKNWFNRCAALVAIGSTKLDSTMLTRLIALYDKETNIDVRRAIALCLAQLDRDSLKGFTRKLKGEFESHLTIVGKYYSKIIFNENNSAQKSISTMNAVSPDTNFYKEHFYIFYLLTKVDKKAINEELAKLLKKNYDEMKWGKRRDQIRHLYKEITNVEL
jgi:retron-type reverse transcriptase